MTLDPTTTINASSEPTAAPSGSTPESDFLRAVKSASVTNEVKKVLTPWILATRNSTTCSVMYPDMATFLHTHAKVIQLPPPTVMDYNAKRAEIKSRPYYKEYERMLPDFQNHIHSLDEDLRELNSSNINKLAEKLQFYSGDIKSTDLSTLNKSFTELMILEMDRTGRDSRAQVYTMSSIANLGFSNTNTGRLIVPRADRDQWDTDEAGYATDVENGTIRVTGHLRPSFAYDDRIPYSPNNELDGFLTSVFIARVIIKLLVDAKAAMSSVIPRPVVIKRSARCIKYNLNHRVTPGLIIYAVTLIRILLGKSGRIDEDDGLWSARDAAAAIQEDFDENPEWRDHVVDTMTAMVYGRTNAPSHKSFTAPTRGPPGISNEDEDESTEADTNNINNEETGPGMAAGLVGDGHEIDEESSQQEDEDPDDLQNMPVQLRDDSPLTDDDTEEPPPSLLSPPAPSSPSLRSLTPPPAPASSALSNTSKKASNPLAKPKKTKIPSAHDPSLKTKKTTKKASSASAPKASIDTTTSSKTASIDAGGSAAAKKAGASAATNKHPGARPSAGTTLPDASSSGGSAAKPQSKAAAKAKSTNKGVAAVKAKTSASKKVAANAGAASTQKGAPENAPALLAEPTSNPESTAAVTETQTTSKKRKHSPDVTPTTNSRPIRSTRQKRA